MTTNLGLVAVAALVAFQLNAAELAALLSASELTTRVQAADRFELLLKDQPEVLGDRAVQDSLISALETENAFSVKNWNAVTTGQKPLYEEGFGEHYSRILRWANRIRAGSDLTGGRRVRLLRALVFGSYNGDSPFAKDLSSEGEDIAPYVLELVKSPIGPERWNGFDLIGLVFTRADAGTLKRPLTAKTRELLRSNAREGLQDPAPDVRRHAVQAVVQAKDTGAIPLLRFMAEKDADAKGKWSVRALAAEGVNRLQRSR